MRSVIVRGFLTRKLRSALTAIAILLGVAMISGTFVLTDKINTAFDDIFAVGQREDLRRRQPGGALLVRRQRLQLRALRRVRGRHHQGLPGVETVAPEIQAQGFLVRGDDKLRPPSNGAPPLVFTVTPPDLTAFTVQEGAMPAQSGQVAVLEDQANDDDITVGEQLQLSTDTGLHPVTVSGILKFGDVSSIGGATVTVLTFPDAQAWFDLEGKTSLVNVRGDGSVSDDQLAAEVRAAVPADLTVRTGQEQADKDARRHRRGDLVPQLPAAGVRLRGRVRRRVHHLQHLHDHRRAADARVRDAAHHRRLAPAGARRRARRGADRRGHRDDPRLRGRHPVRRGLTALFDAVGFGIPSTGTPIELRTVIWAVAVGLGVTVLAAMIPAVRATRVTPIPALREGVHQDAHRPWIRPVIALLVFAAVGLPSCPTASRARATSSRACCSAWPAAPILFFIGVALIATYLVRPVVAVVGVLVGRLGASGKLAMENTTRNTGRTAVTAAALMIGVGLVVFVTILFSGLKDSFTSAVDRSVRGDLIVSSETFGVGLPAEAVPAVEAVDGVELRVAHRVLPARFNGSFTNAMIGVDTERLSDVYRFDWVNGDDALLGDLGTNGALVEKDIAASENLGPGDTLHVESQSGADDRAEGARHVRGPEPPQRHRRLQRGAAAGAPPGQTGINYIFVKDADGADAAKVQDAVETALKQFPIAKVQSNQELKDEVSSQVDQILFIFYALLAMSVIISLFGIVNTLVLRSTSARARSGCCGRSAPPAGSCGG